ncbi:sulfatase-like hydrolase/transferase [Mariniblastus sp.]|nr:sulfatase-like hydrolase/transferase [Mariniblastus sp.]
MIWKSLLCFTLFAFVSPANGQTISVNFHVGNDSNAQAQHELTAGESAGVVASANWNNINVGNAATNSGASVFSTTSLSDDSGDSSAATITSVLATGSSSTSWFVGYAASAAAQANEIALSGTDNDELFNSYLALNGPGGDGSPADAAYLGITGLGADFTANGYDLIIYSDSDRGGDGNAVRESVFTISPSVGSTRVANVQDDEAARPGDAKPTFDGTFIASDNVSGGTKYSNYTIIEGLTAESFTINVTSPDGGRGAISGFQIVAKSDPVMPPDGPNVVLFVVDDMGWADWEQRSDFYETPNMTRLANRGVRFTNGYASSSVCSPTRASLLTGLSPAKHKITKWIPGNPNNNLTNADEPLSDFNLDDSFTTLGEAMQDADYHTAHIGKWHLGQPGISAANPTNHGFDTNIGGNHRGSPPSYTSRNSYLTLPNLDSNINENYVTDHLAVEAKHFIETRVATNQKFFLNFDLYAVHTPIQGHPDYLSFFQNKQDGQIHDNAAYASMLKAMDDALGTVMDTLDAEGVADDTIIIFTSDHGGLTSPSVTSNFPLRGGKGQQWEGGHRVPMIIAGAGVDTNLVGTTSDFQVISHDLYPTILELTGVSGDATHNALVDGVSFLDVLQGSNVGDRNETLLWHFPHESNHNGGPYGAAIDGDYKFIENYQTGEFWLFELSNDIEEQENLIDDLPVIAQALRQDLHDYLWDTEAALWSGNFELLPRSTSVVLGDCDLNGIVDFSDIAPFITLLASGDYLAQADVNRDGMVDFSDISPFIIILAS